MSKSQTPTSSEAAILSRVIQGSKLTLSPEAARALLDLGFSEEDRKKMHELAAKNQQGNLSQEEEWELDSYVRIGRFLDLLSAKAGVKGPRSGIIALRRTDMTRMILSARVGADGVLHVPLGQPEANQEVRVTIERGVPCRSVQEILDDIARNRFKADPDGPSVVDMLREDRNRTRGGPPTRGARFMRRSAPRAGLQGLQYKCGGASSGPERDKRARLSGRAVPGIPQSSRGGSRSHGS